MINSTVVGEWHVGRRPVCLLSASSKTLRLREKLDQILGLNAIVHDLQAFCRRIRVEIERSDEFREHLSTKPTSRTFALGFFQQINSVALKPTLDLYRPQLSMGSRLTQSLTQSVQQYELQHVAPLAIE